MRFIALLILIVPGLLGVYGIKLLRDSFFFEDERTVFMVRFTRCRLHVAGDLWASARHGRDRICSRLYF